MADLSCLGYLLGKKYLAGKKEKITGKVVKQENPYRFFLSTVSWVSNNNNVLPGLASKTFVLAFPNEQFSVVSSNWNKELPFLRQATEHSSWVLKMDNIFNWEHDNWS